MVFLLSNVHHLAYSPAAQQSLGPQLIQGHHAATGSSDGELSKQNVKVTSEKRSGTTHWPEKLTVLTGF